MIEQIGRYRIAGELGRGAMGVVYRAEDPTIGRTVAIKTIRLNDLADPSERERLRDRLIREAQSAGILSHPGIVTIYDIAEKDGLAYIFMEFVNGPTLEDLISNGKLPQPAALVELFKQTAAALDYAHRRGIVHRDVKPANIMVQDEVMAKVTDFGVARILTEQMTQTMGGVMGTPIYMAPEQIQGHPVDGRADQFALAVVIYEALTGERPFAADSLPALVYRIVREEPVALNRLNSSLTPVVDAAVRKGLAKDPEQRYSSCSDMVAAVSTALAGVAGWKPMPPGRGSSMPTVATSSPNLEAARDAAEVPPHPREPAVPPPDPLAPPPELATPPRELRPPPRQLPEPPPEPAKGSLGKGLVLGAVAGAVLLAAFFILPRFSGSEEPAKNTPPPVVGQSESGGPTGAAVASKPSPLAPPIASSAKPADTPAPPPSTDEGAPRPPREAAMHDVTFATEPAGVSIVVDNGAQSCTAPCSLSLPEGRHTLMANREGFRQSLKIFEVPRDADMSFSLEPQAGQLVVTSSPDGASIYVDGKLNAKKTPAVLTLPAGRHSLRLVREGFPKVEEEIDIRDGALKNYSYDFGGGR